MEVNKIYNESCLETMGKMNDNLVDLIITSPPYNMRTRVRNNKYTKRESTKHFSKKYEHFGDDLPIDEFYYFHKKTIAEMLRVSKIICYNFQIVTGSKEAFFKLIGDYAIYIKDIIIWDKGYGQPAMHGNILNSCYELILVMESNAKIGRLIHNSLFERGKMNDILRIGRGKKVSNAHGAVFPEELIEELMTAFSKEGDLVYDPFIGSGTTAIVAEKLNRNWMGSELIKEHCGIAQERITLNKKHLIK